MQTPTSIRHVGPLAKLGSAQIIASTCPAAGNTGAEPGCKVKGGVAADGPTVTIHPWQSGCREDAQDLVYLFTCGYG